jgi:hypothetical protein
MTEPIWAYANIQRASDVFGPIIIAQLEKMKKQIEQMNKSGQGGPPPAVMNFYFGMLDIIMSEEDFFTITLRPQTNVCNMTISTTCCKNTCAGLII